MFCIYQAVSLTRARDILYYCITCQTSFIADGQIAQLVEHVAIDSGCPGYNPGVVHHYFSHLITSGAFNNPWS